MAGEEDLLYILSFVFEIGSVVGIVVLALSLLLIERIKKLFPGGKVVRKYLIMQVMVLVIVVLHILGLILIFYTQTAEIVYITYGGINLAVSIFVFILINLMYKTYKLILIDSKE